MAKITLKDVEYVASLAQLSLDDEAKQRLLREMGDVLAYIVFREDVVTGSLDRDTALQNAPKTDGEYFLVPRILDTE